MQEYSKITRPTVGDLASKYRGAAKASVLKADADASLAWDVYEAAQDALAHHMSSQCGGASDIEIAYILYMEAKDAKEAVNKCVERWRNDSVFGFLPLTSGWTWGFCPFGNGARYCDSAIITAAKAIYLEAKKAGVELRQPPELCPALLEWAREAKAIGI